MTQPSDGGEWDHKYRDRASSNAHAEAREEVTSLALELRDRDA